MESSKVVNEEIYVFQNWQLGIIAKNSEYEKWHELVRERSDTEGIYKHTDGQWGFLYMSFNQEALINFSKEYARKEFIHRKSEFEYIKQVKEQYDKF